MSSVMKVNVSSLSKWKKNLKRVEEATRKNQRRAILTGAYMIHKDAIESIKKGPKSGRTYARGNKDHVASAPGEAPATDTGELVSKIVVRVVDGGDIVDVASRAKYSFALELGTADGRIKPRPFLFPAFQKNIPKIRIMLKNAKGKL